MTTTDRKVRILCVEDDQQMRTFLQAQLKARNFQVQTVRDGAQAIDMAAIFEPQLVLLDLSLPSLDGLTFLRRLREWSGAPVIVLSAHDEEPVKIKALDLGADDYLTKPFSLNELLARVRVALRRADETARLRSSATGSDTQLRTTGFGGPRDGILRAHLIHQQLRDALEHHIGDVLAGRPHHLGVAVDAQRHDGELAVMALRMRIVLAPFDHQVMRGQRAGERVVRRGLIQCLPGRLQFLVRGDELEDVVQPR